MPDTAGISFHIPRIQRTHRTGRLFPAPAVTHAAFTGCRRVKPARQPAPEGRLQRVCGTAMSLRIQQQLWLLSQLQLQSQPPFPVLPLPQQHRITISSRIHQLLPLFHPKPITRSPRFL